MDERTETRRADGGSVTTESTPEQGGDEPSTDPEILRARLAVLEEENSRLRDEYARARRSQYRRTAIGLAVLGVAALAGSAIATGERTVLLALAGTGLFGALLTWTLTPEEFVAASVGEQITAAHAADRDALCAELGLQNERIYVPTGESSAKLFVPQRQDYELPESLDGLLLVPEEPAARGVAFTPTGIPLFQTARESATGAPAEEPGALAAQLVDAVVEQFELARSASVSADQEGDGVVVRVERATFGDLAATDHPVLSTIATGLAIEFDQPVAADVADGQNDGAVLTFQFLEP